MAIYVFGFAVKATDKHSETIIDRFCWIYLVFGAVFCTGYGMLTVTPSLSVPPDIFSIKFWLSSALNGFVRGFGQWFFVIGAMGVMGQMFTKPKEWHSLLRRMAMPFYLIHLQVLVVIASGALWVPYLRALPVMLVIASLVIGFLSYLITEKIGQLRYFFGLPTPQGSTLPGETLRGYVPALLLSGLVVLHTVLAYLL